MPFDVVLVADKARISLAAALNIVISRKTCPEARFTVAVPEDSGFDHPLAEEVIKEFAHDIISIPAPRIEIDGKSYRLENKVNAIAAFGSRPALLVDSDMIFLRPLPAEFLFQEALAAVPEHGKHDFPWNELYSALELEMPRIKVLLGAGDVSAPWFNAGFVSCPDATKFGAVWRMICEFVLRCDWVPERWPYLDQIALPLAFAQLSANKTVTFANVLPARFNQNIFVWAKDQNYIHHGYVVHHHNQVRLIERYLPNVIMWLRHGYPIIDKIVEAFREYDTAPEIEA